MVDVLVRWHKDTVTKLQDCEWFAGWEYRRMLEMQETFRKRVCMSLVFCHRSEFKFSTLELMPLRLPLLTESFAPPILNGGACLNVRYSKRRGSPTSYHDWWTGRRRFRNGPCPWRDNYTWTPRDPKTCLHKECVLADMQIANLDNAITVDNIAEFLPAHAQEQMQQNKVMLETYFILEFESSVVEQLDVALLELQVIAFKLKCVFARQVIPFLCNRYYTTLGIAGSAIELPHVTENILWHFSMLECSSSSYRTWPESHMLQTWRQEVAALRSCTAHMVVKNIVMAAQCSSWYCGDCADKVLSNCDSRFFKRKQNEWRELSLASPDNEPWLRDYHFWDDF